VLAIYAYTRRAYAALLTERSAFNFRHGVAVPQNRAFGNVTGSLKT